MAQEKLNPKKFGSFVLLDHLVDGGMATIYRALALSVGSNNNNISKRIIAIKTINEVYSKDEQYKIMFNDEVNVAFGLTHPNIAQIHSFGEEEGKLYTAMEYISGRNLRQYEKKSIKFPKEIVAYIISQTAVGLDYVHKFSDKFTGKHLNIIHRDISPQNIMLCYNGEVKIVDFGIAKANTNTQETQAGTLKGKVSYLAPEYLNEEIKLDGRYDQFSLGIVFWEMLTGTRLFEGPNEMAIIKKIFECKIPDPAMSNPLIDNDLKIIVMKMLKMNKEERYSDMSAVSAALNEYLLTHFQGFNQKTVESYLYQHLKNEITIEQEHIQRFGMIDLAPFLNEVAKSENKADDIYLSPRERKLREIDADRQKRKLSRQSDLTKTEQFKEDARRLVQEKIRHEMSAAKGETEETLVIARTRTKIEIDRKPLNQTKGIQRPASNKTQTQIKLPVINETKTIDVKKSTSLNSGKYWQKIAVALILIILIGGFFYLNFLNKSEVKNVEAEITKKVILPQSRPASIPVEEIKKEVLKKADDFGHIIFEGGTSQHEVFIDGAKIENFNLPIEYAFNKKIKIKILKDKNTVLEQDITLTPEEKEQIIIMP
jgi:serine/threonine protein kinase